MNKNKIISGFLSASVAIGLLASCGGETNPAREFWNRDNNQLMGDADYRIRNYHNTVNDYFCVLTSYTEQEGRYGLKVYGKDNEDIVIYLFTPEGYDEKVFYISGDAYYDRSKEKMITVAAAVTAECFDYKNKNGSGDLDSTLTVTNLFDHADDQAEAAELITDNVKMTAKYDRPNDIMYYIIEDKESSYGANFTPIDFKSIDEANAAKQAEEARAANMEKVEAFVSNPTLTVTKEVNWVSNVSAEKQEDKISVVVTSKESYSELDAKLRNYDTYYDVKDRPSDLKQVARKICGITGNVLPVSIAWNSKDGENIASVSVGGKMDTGTTDNFVFTGYELPEKPKPAPAPKEEPAPAEKEEPVEINTARHSEEDSKFVAGQVVKAESPTPSTVEVCPWRDMTVQDLGNGHYQVVGWVDMENVYGAMIRYDFLVYYTATETGYKEYGAEFFPRGG